LIVQTGLEKCFEKRRFLKIFFKPENIKRPNFMFFRFFFLCNFYRAMLRTARYATVRRLSVCLSVWPSIRDVKVP